MILSKKFLMEQLKEFIKDDEELNLRTCGLKGVPFASDIALYLAIINTVKNKQKYINEINIFEELNINTLDDFINFAIGYHGSPAKEFVYIHNMINAPLLFNDIHKTHLEYIEHFPKSQIKALLVPKYIPNILDGTKYFMDELDDIEMLTLLNSCIRGLSKGELLDLYVNDNTTVLNINQMKEVSTNYITDGVPEKYKSVDEMFKEIGFNIQEILFKYLQRVPYSDSHYRPNVIKDKCNEIILKEMM